MTTTNPLQTPPKPIPKMSRRGNPGGAYSLRLKRGSLGEGINGSSSLGRFIRALERELTDYVGGNPDIAERLTIDRVIRCRVQLDLLEKKLASGKFNDRNRRLYSTLSNGLRFSLRELKPAASRNQPNLASYLASLRAANPEADAPANPSTAGVAHPSPAAAPRPTIYRSRSNAPRRP